MLEANRQQVPQTLISEIQIEPVSQLLRNKEKNK